MDREGQGESARNSGKRPPNRREAALSALLEEPPPEQLPAEAGPRGRP